MSGNDKAVPLDERFDAGEPVPTDQLVMNRDDFDSDEAMEHYFKDHPEAPRQAYDAYKEEKSAGHQQKVTVSSQAATGTAVFTLNGLHYKNVVQTAYVGTQYVYTTQQINNSGVGATQIITRFPLNGSSLNAKDYMTLRRFGHGETLQWGDHNGKDYFWVVAKATQVDNPDASGIDWGTQIARIQYQAGASIDYTDVPRFSSINHANKSGSSFGTLKRCEAALDSSRNYLMIWSMNTSNTVQFAYYNAAGLNNILDTQEAQASKYISAGDASVVAQCVKSYTSSDFYNKVAHQSVQGIEFSDGQAIYISSGGVGNQPVIQKGNWGTTDFTPYAVAVEGAEGSVLNNPVGNEVETEGIQLKGDYVYLNVSLHSDSSKVIFTVPKSDF
ncbi:helveticin J family class III bacteriocin [Sporolactobacillus nakayamae]|nr:helveticin J family class III bacteriocin [Sporolactobacillus nakayamae]